MVSEFHRLGWQVLAFSPDVKRWADAARGPALSCLTDPEFSQWHVCENTWFVGVDALPNDALGQVGSSGPLPVTDIEQVLGQTPPLHRAQVSAVYPGYPRPREGETEAGFRYRQNRDAAHVDGLHAVGRQRRRKILECHRFILGLPLTQSSAQASPLVVWDGSHEIMRQRLQSALSAYPEKHWAEVDLTEIYQAARREVFKTCTRREVPTNPGEAVLLHRLILHGVAPWAATDTAPRMIAYFRPQTESGIAGWLSTP